MLSLTFIVIFIFCAAITSASILVAHQFIAIYNTEFHRNYFYFLVTYFSFAFYGIWAPIIMRVILGSIDVDANTIETVINFLPVLGVPFLLISWLMLVKMGFSLVAVKPDQRAFRLYLVYLGIVIAVASGFFFFKDNFPTVVSAHIMYTEMAVFIVLELGYMFLFSGIVRHYLKRRKRSHSKIVARFVILMLLALVLRLGALPFAFSGPWIVGLVILVYFISIFAPLFYLKLNSPRIFVPLRTENPNGDKKELIYSTYEITNREKEVIEQICLGKTNQQIADELFISLQTVKDHTHRIYTKIGINSRMKLVQMLNGQ